MRSHEPAANVSETLPIVSLGGIYNGMKAGLRAARLHNVSRRLAKLSEGNWVAPNSQTSVTVTQFGTEVLLDHELPQDFDYTTATTLAFDLVAHNVAGVAESHDQYDHPQGDIRLLGTGEIKRVAKQSLRIIAASKRHS